MSGREVNELIVALRPEGADETIDALDETQDSFVETAETAEDASEDLEDFSQRFTGAMAVATTALGIAAAGVLSKVPILQSAFAGIDSVLTSLGLSIDQFLRDLGFEGVVDGIFDVSDAIDDADPKVRDLVGAFTLLGIAVGGATLALEGFLLLIKGSVVLKALGAIAGSISLVGVALVALAAITAFAIFAMITNFKGYRDFVFNVFGAILDFFMDWGSRFAEGAMLWGKRFEIIFDGWTNSVHRTVVESMNGIIATVENAINSVIQTINRFSQFTGISLETVALGRIEMPEKVNTQQRLAGNRMLLAMRSRRNKQEMRRIGNAVSEALNGEIPDEIRTILEIDGKKTAEQTSRWRGTSVANRGR